MCRYGFLCVYSVCVGVCVCDRECVWRGEGVAWPREQHQRKSPLFTRAKETLSKAFGGEPAQKHSFGSEAFYFAAECLFDWPPLLMCRTTGPGQARDPESG